MRFDEIQIPAFGPFTDFKLPLPKGARDLHLIYGPNEAGKSSLLRALRHLLYGIPARTSDSFRHRNRDLQIGATLSHEKNSLTFFRKKGNRNTLLDGEGGVLADDRLKHFLGPGDEDFFAKMFGLDTDGLREGAQQLLSGEGEFGAAVFSAARGGAPINEAIRKLEEEAHALYKDRSRNTTIAVLLRELREAEKAAQDETISTRQWQALKTALREAEEEFARKDEARNEHLARRDFVNRCLQALPVMQKIRRVEKELAEISLPELPPDFAERVRGCEQAVASARQAVALHHRRREALEADRAAIPDPGPILERAGALDLLHRRAERYEGALEAISDDKSRIATLDGLLNPDARLEDYPAIDSGTLASFKKTSQGLAAAETRAGQLKADLANLEARMEKSRATLESLGKPGDLEDLRELAAEAGNFAAQRKGLPADLEAVTRLETKVNHLRERLGVGDEPATLRVPSRATLEERERERRDLLEKVNYLEKEVTACRDDIQTEQAALDHLASGSDLHSAEDLQEIRDRRDGIWTEILKSGEPREDLTGAIRRADEVADALRRDADLLATAAGHRVRLQSLASKKRDFEDDLAAAREALTAWTKEWETKSAREVGQLPTDLIAWREDWERLCQLHEQLEEEKRKVARLLKEEKTLLERLGGDDFDEAHRRLRRDLEKALEDQGNREATRQQLTADQLRFEQLEPERNALESERARLRTEWEQLCESISLSSELSCPAALREIEARLLVRVNLRERLELQGELEEKESFVQEHRTLLDECARALGVEASEPVLFELFEKAKEQRNRRQTLSSQLARLEDDGPKLETDLEKAEEELAALKALAGCHELEEVLVAFELRRNHREALAGQTDLLEGLAGGADLEQFRADLGEHDPDLLRREAEGLEEAGTVLQEERDRAKEAWDDLRREERELRRAGDLAAHFRQEAADARSAIATHFRRFRELHHAIAFLRQQVEAYREQAQGPMVTKTSEIFRTLTQGAFERVVARPDDKDIPRLLALRASGEEVTTAGLSEGTCDQLYLALRFAALDLHFETHPPMPLILDDLLMTFDDERVQALLPVLEEMSEKTQVLIFTHHEHLIGLMEDRARIHRVAAS